MLLLANFGFLFYRERNRRIELKELVPSKDGSRVHKGGQLNLNLKHGAREIVPWDLEPTQRNARELRSQEIHEA